MSSLASPLISKVTRKMFALFAATCALAMMLLDASAFPILLPYLQENFGVTALHAQWLMNGYFVTSAALVIVCGRVVDTLGVKRAFNLGLALFALANIFMSFADSYPALLFGRVFQGIATAFLGPAGFTILFDTFPHKERGRAIGLSAGFGGLFYAIGPFFAGIALEFYNYHLLFWAYLPIALLGMIAARYGVLEKKRKREVVDLTSVVLIILSVSALVIGMMQYRVWGVYSYFVGCTGGVAMSSLGALYFRRRSMQTQEVDLSLMKNGQFRAGLILTFLTAMVMVNPVFWAFFLQKGLFYSPIESASYIVLSTLPVVIMAPASGLLADTRGPQFPIFLGFFSVLVSVFAWILFSIYHSVGFMILAFAAFGVGTSLILTPIGSATLAAIPPEKRGIASGIYNTMRYVGSSLGILVFGYMNYHSGVEIFERLKLNSLGMDKFSFSGAYTMLTNTSKKMNPEMLDSLKSIYTHSAFAGMSAINICNGFIAIIALLITLVYLKEYKANN